ncbi:MAG: hypothetical protein COS89_04515 [Deltaproteobacteria bacterium CG07_land_8_20_14_0_80_38_7]|nr:MAG: hypothetical protein COS89_04515 [Deltaproteobacteria bacterium CG07_land_8_20_14_0_80_38_7]
MGKNNSLDMDKQIFVVEASAGSGKTYALARRYLKLLLNASARQEEESLRSILAITFMNKTAVEMKERILELLKRLALDTFKNESQKKDLLEYIGLDEKTCKKASFQAMQEIIRRYDYFQVQTIDSFINSLLLGCAFRLGLSANFNIREGYNKHIASSLDQLLDSAAQSKEVKKLFIDFVWNYLRIENHSGWLAKNDILSVTESLFSEFNRYGVPFYSHPIKDKEIVAKKKVVYQKILKIIKEIDRDGINKRFVNGIKSFAEKNDEHFHLGELKSACWKKEEVPYNKGVLVSNELNAEWNNLRGEISALCEMEAYSLFNPYIEIFNEVFKKFLLQSQKEDILFLEELNARASQLFGKDTISVPEIFIRIGSRFQHFLIDEFQDTSVLQWNNIFLLAEEALSKGGTLFYVGDKKQAIYRFRGGEAKLFNTVKKELEQFGEKEEVLSTNYRSSKEVVEFNNRIFSPENIKQFVAGYNANQEEKSNTDTSFNFSPLFEQELLQVFSHSVQNPTDKPVGYVSVERFEIQPEKSEESNEGEDDEESSDIVKEKLLKLVKELYSRSFEYKDIAVLSRSASNVEKISGWLIEEGIPIESERTLNIRENGLIKEITSFLKFLDSPIDNLSFASFILGEIFCTASGIAKTEIEDFLFKNKKNKKDPNVFAPHLYRAFKKDFPQVWEKYIEIFFKNVGFMPLYEMLVTIYANFGVLDRFPDNQSFFMSFLELVKKKEDEHSSIKAFLEYFNDAINKDLYVKFPSSSAVKVMTVHKAKGLEFQVVIIPFLKIAPNGESSTDNRSTSYTPNLDHEAKTLRLLRLKKVYREFSPEIKDRYNDEFFRSFIDELNNIYVSFTRAKQELYIFIANKPGKTNTVDFLIPSDFTELGSKGEPPKKEAEKESQYTLRPAHYSDWIEMLKNEFKETGQLKFHKQIKKGEIMHYVFSLLGNLYGKDLDVELSLCIELTQVRFPEFDDFEGIKEKIKTLINDGRFKKLFFCEAGKVFTEKEVVNCFGDTRCIDWLIVKDDTAVIVDFKSGTEVEDQEKQVKEYIDLISAIYPEKKVSGYLLYVDNLKIKEVR